MAKRKKYFHELTLPEFKVIVDESDLTWGEFAEIYPKPNWCSRIDAVMPNVGCPDLRSMRVRDVMSCTKCEFFMQ